MLRRAKRLKSVALHLGQAGMVAVEYVQVRYLPAAIESPFAGRARGNCAASQVIVSFDPV